MNSDLRQLLQTHTEDGLLAEIDPLADLSDHNFKEDLYPRWVQVDENIPGPGLQYAFWHEGNLADYPFDCEFERVTRPLRYVVYSLRVIGTPNMSTRAIVQHIGAHLEGGVKDLCGVTTYNQPVSFRTAWGYMPLGALVKNPFLRRRLGKDLCHAITQFCRLAWNPAKHKFTNNGFPDPMIPFADAVCSYFLARALGAQVLHKSGRLDPLMQAIKVKRGRYQPSG